MSESSTVVTEAHFEYLAKRTVGEDGFLASLRKAAHEAGLPPISIAPEQGSFLQILLRASGAREVVEVGTLAGYSAIWMARALPREGGVRTIEFARKHVEFARAWIAKSDVYDRVQVFEGKGMDVLPSFADDSADAAFLDADKASYPAYLEQSLRIVRKGGWILADNAFAFGQLLDETPTDREVGAIRAFNDLMAREKRVQALIVPIGDGLWVGVKK